jgi:hypothetical protein
MMTLSDMEAVHELQENLDLHVERVEEYLSANEKAADCTCELEVVAYVEVNKGLNVRKQESENAKEMDRGKQID